jgi:hypothetical protein
MEEATVDDTPLANRRTPRVRRIPARFLVNHVGVSDEGGDDLLCSILESGDELEVECENGDFAMVARCLIDAEVAFAGAALAEPINDPNEKDPKTLREAQASMYWSHWLIAIHEELEALKAKGVHEDIDELPPNRKAVESKWVLHIKRDQDGLIARFKARLVAKGFTQIPGQDFNYMFAPVARWESIRTLLTLAADRDMVLRQVDVKTAFLNGPLDEEIYMRKPSIVGNGYWRLRRGLYGLKQAGRQWYLELNTILETLGFKRTESDWSLYRRTHGKDESILATSVDDMLIASTSDAESDAVVAALASRLEITDNGEPKLHLGCTIERDRVNRTIKLHQKSYTESILRDFNFDKCNSVSTPMDPGTRLGPNSDVLSANDEQRVKVFPYTAIVGKAMYLSTCTRPDIAYTVRELARFMTTYGPAHVTAAKHLLRYLKGSASHGILLGGGTETLHPTFKALTDSDWGMGDTRKSVSGFLIMMGDSPLSWSSKQQAVVALSSCEAEYLASTHCARDILWFRNLFAELGNPQIQPTTLFCDNQGTVACTHDPHAHSKMKHISIREHFIRDCVMKRLIDVVHVSNKENIADLFTKPLHRILHSRWVKMLRLDAGQGGVLKHDLAIPS